MSSHGSDGKNNISALAAKLAPFRSADSVDTLTASSPKPVAGKPDKKELPKEKALQLLVDLNERLKRSESEREFLWKELEATRRHIGEIEDRSTRTEKAYIQLQNTISNKDRAAEELLERQLQLASSQKMLAGQIEDTLGRHKELESRIETSDTKQGGSMVKINELLNENVKLTRRLDQMNQDKVRILRKIEVVEDTLSQTQDTLRAKALVFLTDQSVSSGSNLPKSPALDGLPPPSARADKLNDAGFRPRIFGDIPLSRMATAAVIILGLAGGLALSQTSQNSWKNIVKNIELPSFDLISKDTLAAAPATSVVSQAAETPQTAAKLSQESLLKSLQDAEAKAADAVNKQVADQAALKLEPDTQLPTSVQAIEAQAFSNSADAQHDLAAIYTAGHAGVKRDYERALKWFEAAAQNGVANARYNLAVMAHQGLGTEKNPERAIELYRAAAYLGHPEAEYNLGIAAIQGSGLTYDPYVAEAYFRRAAAKGVIEAAYNLGLIQENGLLGGKNNDAALFWYKLAADKGNIDSEKAFLELKDRLWLTGGDVDNAVRAQALLYPDAVQGLGAKIPAAAEIRSALATPASETATTPASTPVKTVKSIAKAANPPAPPTALKEPLSNHQAGIVAQIQEHLVRLGYYTGPSDGVETAQTTAAVQTYQKDANLKSDGKTSEDLLVHLLAREFSMDALTSPAAGQAEEFGSRN